jgi:hypothetical protein
MVANDRKPSTQTVYNPRLGIFKQISPSPPQKKTGMKNNILPPLMPFYEK